MEERGGVKYGRVIFMIVSLVTVDTRRSPAPDVVRLNMFCIFR